MSEEFQTGAEVASDLDSTVQDESPVQTDEVTVEASGDEVAAAETVEEVQEANEFLLENEIDEFESEIEKALAEVDEEKDPAFYRNALKQYQRHLKQNRESAAPFKDLQGVVSQEQLPDTVDMLRALNNYRVNETGVPAPDVSKFADLFEKNYADITPNLVMELGKRLVPGSNQNYFATALEQQYGITPAQIEQIKAYIDNNDLPDVPPQYAEAFKALPPELQEELPLMSDEAKLNILARAQADLDRTNQEKQTQTQAQQRFTQEVETAAEQRYLKGAENAMDAFAKTLEKVQFSSDPNVNSLIVEENLHLILNALNPYAAGYNRAQSVMAKIGVNLDEGRVNGILDNLAEESRNIEYFNRTNKPEQAKASEVKYARSLQELIAQGHKVAGQLLKVRGQGLTASATSQATQLRQTEARPVINGGSATANPNDWLKNMPMPGTPEYREAVAQLATAAK